MSGRYRGVGLAAALAISAAPAAEAIDLFVRSPRASDIVFGMVDVEVEVLSAEPVAEVLVHLDGALVGRLTEPPWRLRVDAGEDNRNRVFEVTARDLSDNVATGRVVTQRLELDDEVDLELQQLYVSVVRGEQRLLDLGLEDFAVIDNGVAQRIVTFERGEVPLTAAILLDASLSMRGENLASALAAAEAFIADMRPLDEASLTLFADREIRSTPFTGDPSEVRSVMSGVRASGGTSVNDHLYLALDRLAARSGRKVVILLTDGVDVESVLGMDDVLWKASRTQALIYWIRPSAYASRDLRHFSAWRDPERHRREISALERAVAASGGRIHDIDHIDAAAAAFREILAELREQYVFGYYPSINRDDGAWHTVRVRVRGGGVRVRARDGYHDTR